MSAELLKEAVERLRDPSRCNGNPYELALAELLEDEIGPAKYREAQQQEWEATRVRPEPFPVYYDRTTKKAIAVARLIVGAEST